MTIAALRTNVPVLAVFVTLTATYLLLVLAKLGINPADLLPIAGRPGREHPQHDPMRGLVQGGQHVGGGRSVAPHRDKPVPEGGGDPPEQDL